MISLISLKRILKSKGKLVKTLLLSGTILFLIYYSFFHPDEREFRQPSQGYHTGSRHGHLGHDDILGKEETENPSIQSEKSFRPLSEGKEKSQHSVMNGVMNGIAKNNEDLGLWSEAKGEVSEVSEEKKNIGNLPIYQLNSETDVEQKDDSIKADLKSMNHKVESHENVGENVERVKTDMQDQDLDDKIDGPKKKKVGSLANGYIKSEISAKNGEESNLYDDTHPQTEEDLNPGKGIQNENLDVSHKKLDTNAVWTYNPSAPTYAIAYQSSTPCQALVSFKRLTDLHTPPEIDFILLDSSLDPHYLSKFKELGVKVGTSSELSNYSKYILLSSDAFAIKRIDGLLLLPAGKSQNEKLKIVESRPSPELLPADLARSLTDWNDEKVIGLNELASKVYVTFDVGKRDNVGPNAPNGPNTPNAPKHPFVGYVNGLYSALKQEMC